MRYILFLVISNTKKFNRVVPGKDNQSQLLENIDNWSYRTIGLGFPFLTIGII